MKNVLMLLLLVLSFCYSGEITSVADAYLNVQLVVDSSLIIDNGVDTITVATFDHGVTWHRLSEDNTFDTILSSSYQESTNTIIAEGVPARVGYTSTFFFRDSIAFIKHEIYKSDLITVMVNQSTYTDGDPLKYIIRQ